MTFKFLFTICQATGEIGRKLKKQSFQVFNDTQL